MKRPEDAPVVVPYKTTAKLWATGRWSGGKLTIRDGKRPLRDSLEINGHPWVVLAVLMYHGRYDEPDAEAWISRGFLTKCEIAALAWKLGGVRISEDEVARHIHHLRNAIAASWNDRRKGREWADCVVEHSDSLGYRVSTPGKNLHLNVKQDLAKPSSTADDGRAVAAPIGIAIRF